MTKLPWLTVVMVGTLENLTRAEAVGVSDFLNKLPSSEMIERSASGRWAGWLGLPSREEEGIMKQG